MSDVALSLDGIHIAYPTPEGERRVVAGVSLEVPMGRTLGIVGESGSGKSMTLRAMCDLVPAPGEVVEGAVHVGGRRYERAAGLDAVRGGDVTMIFQDPAATLNPVRTVGSQLVEVLRTRAGRSRSAAAKEAIELLDRVGIPDPAGKAKAYPHELSGGQRQRVMIAIAIAPQPRVILADEPTTALDVTTQRQILALLRKLQEENGMAIVLVTHDLGVVAQTCHEVVTLYAGCVVERGETRTVLDRPQHPYTRALIDAMPSLSTKELPVPIDGRPPEHASLDAGCPFMPRCDLARDECAQVDVQRETLTTCACPFERTR